jgi:hypothetical protein
MVRSDAAALIAHEDHDFAGGFHGLDADARLALAVFDGVVDNIVHHLENFSGIGRRSKRPLPFRLKFNR